MSTMIWLILLHLIEGAFIVALMVAKCGHRWHREGQARICQVCERVRVDPPADYGGPG